jgi:hypothetical protein
MRKASLIGLMIASILAISACDDVQVCQEDADCGGALLSCGDDNVCRTSLTMYTQGTAEWPDQACNPDDSFGACDTNAQEHADAWATKVCSNNGWPAGVWTGEKMAGCSNTDVEDDPSVSMYCIGGSIPCNEDVETECRLDDQTVVQFICLL